MTKIYILCDYKGYFGSKYNAVPYNSGMDKSLLSKSFANFGYDVVYKKFSDVKKFASSYWKNQVVLYTSSEDVGYHYKAFIEDIIFYLEECGANTLPAYKFLRANNNKVFMELLAQSIFDGKLDLIESRVYGTLEEFKEDKEEKITPLVFKEAGGAMSKGVALVETESNFMKIIGRRTFNWNLKEIFREFIRQILYKGYHRESFFRNKFVIQNFVDFANEDYKVLNFGNRFYVLRREARKNDFRASGSGIRIFPNEVPEEILFFSKKIVETLNVPNCSLDIGFDGRSFRLLEYQAVYFGSFTLTYSDKYWYWDEQKDEFVVIHEKSVLEEVYTESIVGHLQN